jgi:protein-S-isoprenylcysteine O-methyltransferase Ste14
MLLLIVAATIAGAVVLSVVAVGVSEVIHPDVDTSGAAAALSGIISTLVGLLAGFLAGRTNGKQNGNH